MRRIAVVLFAFAAFACTALCQLPYKNFRSAVPERKTEYYASTTARGGIKMTITAKFEAVFTCYPYPDMRQCEDVTQRTYIGLMEQKDGKFVAFDPKNPADKIIDRDLIGWVIFISQQAIQEDAQYIKTSAEFTDNSGQRWVKP